MSNHYSPQSAWRIEPLQELPNRDWLRMRMALWPDVSEEEHLSEMQMLLDDPARFAQFAVLEGVETLGFAEASIRTDYVNGTSSSPVGYLEGIYVVPHARGRDVARSLVDAVAEWARGRGCVELASDTSVEDEASQAFHQQVGFEETERTVFFTKRIAVVEPESRQERTNGF